MAEPPVNHFCRLCKAIIWKGNRFSHTKKIYEREGPDNKSIYLRLAHYGLELKPHDNKSIRICQKCSKQVQTMEESLLTFNKWKRSEEGATEPTVDRQPGTTTPPRSTTPPRAEKRIRSPSKTPRKDKRQRQQPPTPNRKTTPLKTPGTRLSVVEVRISYHVLTQWFLNLRNIIMSSQGPPGRHLLARGPPFEKR